MNETTAARTVLVIGAGPAGIFSAQELAEQGYQVILLNRDIRPGGLAEYGIYHDKFQVKTALRAQFHKILARPEVTYVGNVTVSDEGDVTLALLREMGFAAIVVAVGAQGTKSLGLPGEQLPGVYHAKDLIYYYNGLPPYSEQNLEIGRRVALIGVGNVMADLAHWLVRDLKVDEVTAVARRGPAEVKFTPQELAYVAANLDLEALDREFDRVRERMVAIGQDPDATKEFILSALPRAHKPISDTRLSFRFLSSPSRILGDEAVTGLEMEETALTITADGRTRAQGLSNYAVLDVDTVIFCIGDRVSEDFGLPVQWFSFVKHPEPRYAMDGACFEAYDPEAREALEGIFVVGWARQASAGQVGLARKDARNCIKAVTSYLADTDLASPPHDDSPAAALMKHLRQLDKPIVSTTDALRLAEIEALEADRRGDPGFRYTNNEEMLSVLERVPH
jgi:ferredoxin/flavodoxin---NADP+ reductase